jgi:hypothetical protein
MVESYSRFFFALLNLSLEKSIDVHVVIVARSTFRRWLRISVWQALAAAHSTQLLVAGLDQLWSGPALDQMVGLLIDRNIF